MHLFHFSSLCKFFLCFAAIGGHFGFSFLCSLLCEHFLISVIANTPYDTISVKQNMPEAEKLTWKASLTDLFSGVILLRVQFFFFKLKITCKQPTRTGCVGSVKYKLLSFAFSFFCAMLSLTLITCALLLMHG